MGTTGFHLYQRDRGNNYNYIDRVVKNYIEMGGGLFHLYPMKAIIDSNGNERLIGEDGLTISDSVFVENSGRKYSKETFDMYGVTQMKQPSWTTLFSGLSSIDGDEKEVHLHYNSMIAQLGRKIIVGDVIEVSWLRDLDILGKNYAANRFFVVTSSERDEGSWDPTYQFHVWVIKMKPITNAPEFADLFNNDKENEFYEDLNSRNGGGGINQDLTQDNNLQDINDAVLEEAEEYVSYRLHDEHHAYLDKTDDTNQDGRFIPIGIDGIPAELNCDDVEQGLAFPENPQVGMYFLKTCFNPPRLYLREEGKWKMIGYDLRTKWTGAPNMLLQNINQDGYISFNDGTKMLKRQNIKDVVKAKTKKEGKNKRDWKEIIKEKFDETPSGI